MWTRKKLKSNAKEVLKLNYWKAFVVSLVILFAGGDNNGFGGGSGGSTSSNYVGSDFGESLLMISIIIGVVLLIIVLRVFIGYILEVGGRKFFIKASEGENAKISSLIDYFGSDSYTNILLTMLLKFIYIFLWTLLLIIPGIIKSYAYRMVPYILADNPNIGAKRAIELSDEMTDGHKWDIFVLDLSFLGWYLLGALLLLVGTLFVLPYENATNAELYLKLRKNAVRKGLTSNNELNIY